ncbi:MAG: DUF4332 domain-containing protein [Candidatus Methylomirabilales bacterium]
MVGLAATRRLPWYGWVGLAGLLGGEIGLLAGIQGVRILFYCIAWWSYILLADGLAWRRRGESLLRTRPWEFLVLAFWSIALWNIFELINFRLQNWFYINVPLQVAQAAVYSFFAYATVLPGIFETYDLLRAYGVGDGWRMRPWRIRPTGLAACVAVGLAMLLAPLLWPRYAFPLIWGFAVFLLDPVCYLSRRVPSFLAQFERGDPRPFLRLLLAGLICGGLWEFWNHWAYTKWLYTVPYFEDAKWFEMPPLGFLGFPPFALECYVLVNVLTLFRRGRGWEGAPAGPGAPRRLAVAGVVLAIGFNLAVYAGIERLTVESFAPSIADLRDVPRETVERLAAVGIASPPEFLRRTATPGQLEALAGRSGIPAAALGELRQAMELVDLKGLGARNYRVLSRLGVRSVEALARQEPEALHQAWRASPASRVPPAPRLRVWVRAAHRAAGSSAPGR